MNDPSKFKFTFPLSNTNRLILEKSIELQKIHSKERNFFVAHLVLQNPELFANTNKSELERLEGEPVEQ